MIWAVIYIVAMVLGIFLGVVYCRRKLSKSNYQEIGIKLTGTNQQIKPNPAHFKLVNKV